MKPFVSVLSFTNFSIISAAIFSIFLMLSSVYSVNADCMEVTCYCGVQVSCGASNEDCIKACGDIAPTPGYTPSNPSYDWQAEQSRQEQIEREARQRKIEEAEEEARRRDEYRKKQFEQDKQDALNLLKSGSSELGFKGVSGGELDLKGAGQTDLKLKDSLFSKGNKESAPPDLGNLDSKWPIVIDLKTVQGGTPQVLKTANLRTHVLLDALEAGAGDWEASIRYLTNRLADSPTEQYLKDALNLLRGYHEGYLGAKNISDNYYKYGVRRWLDGDFDHAARSFALAVRENPDDIQIYASFAHALGLRDGSGRCRTNTQCSHIDIPTKHITEETGIIKEVKVKLDKLREDVKADPDNLQLRSTLNHLEGWAGYNDYINAAFDEKKQPLDKEAWELTNKGLNKIAEGDYAGAWKDFTGAYKDNSDARGILFAMNYSKGLFAAQVSDTENVPETLWDQRTDEVYAEYFEEMMGKMTAEMSLPEKLSTNKMTQQLINTKDENPFFGLLSDEDIERLMKGDESLFR